MFIFHKVIANSATAFKTPDSNNSCIFKMPSEIKDKNGEPIKEGDHVFARWRSGSHEGEVEKIVTSKEEADKEGVKHPPKVWLKVVQGFSDMLCCTGALVSIMYFSVRLLICKKGSLH